MSIIINSFSDFDLSPFDCTRDDSWSNPFEERGNNEQLQILSESITR